MATLPTVLNAQNAQVASTSQKEAKPSMTVTLQAPKSMLWHKTVQANGTVLPWQELSVVAQTAGLRLMAWQAEVGQYVAKGQVLALLDDATLRAERVQMQAQLSEVKAVAAEAQAHAQRAQPLHGGGALSEQQLTQINTAAATAQARVAAAEAALALQDLRIQQAKVVAPESGVVVQRPATLGAVVSGGIELFRLIRQGRLEWVAEVGATDIAHIRAGQAVRVRAPGGAEVVGKVRLVAPTVDAQTRNAKVHVDLPAHEGIKAGMFASGHLQTGEATGWGVPESAVVYRDGFAYVFVLKDAQRVQRLKVSTGQRQGNWVELTAGLPDAAAQAQVVVAGAGFLNDGDKVKVVTP
jgi:RND family efflux transporter MFP subunit